MSWFNIIKLESLKELQEERRNNFIIYKKLTGLFGSLKPLLKLGITANTFRAAHNQIMGFDIDLNELERAEAKSDSIQTRVRMNMKTWKQGGHTSAFLTFKVSIFTEKLYFHDSIRPDDLVEIIKKYPEFNVKIDRGRFNSKADIILLLKQITKDKLTGRLRKYNEGYYMVVTPILEKLFIGWYRQPLLIYFDKNTLNYITAIMESGTNIESLVVEDI